MATSSYREIAGDLRAAILRGDYRPGDTIPKRAELMATYGVSTTTVRQAIALLRTEGLVAPIRRRGTIVRDRTPVRLSVARYTDVLASPGDRGPWETACAQQGVPGRTEIVAVDQRPADRHVAARLGIPEGAPVVYRLQHMYAGEQVGQLQETWLPLTLVEGTPLASAGKVVGGIYRALSAIGHPPVSASESVTSRMPTRAEAETLSLDLGSPVLAIDRITRGHDGHALALAHAVIAGDRVQLHYDQTFPAITGR
ncbi:MAG: GntR family transcriptional regulator [Pseudonocardiaceae bacterium]